MVKTSFVFFCLIGFFVLSCSGGDDSPSGVEVPKGFTCQCEQSDSLNSITASSIKEAEKLCTDKNGRIKQCAKNQ